MTKSPLLLPRFTIRTLIAIVTIFAFAFVVVGTAVRGQYWAWGVTIAIFSLIITALSHSIWFGIVWFFARMPEARPILSEATLTSSPVLPAAGNPSSVPADHVSADGS